MLLSQRCTDRCLLADSPCQPLPSAITPWRCVHASCFTNASFTSPALLLFFHISKTGGTSVMTWLDRLVRPPARLTASFRYGRPSCLFGLFPERFPHDRWKPRCGRAEKPDWRTSRFAFEFHTWSAGVFLRKVVPNLSWLRAQYRTLGGEVVVCTLLREPVSHMLSFYAHMPPTDENGHVLPLNEDVIHGAQRLQQRALTGRKEVSSSSWEPRKERACEEDLAASRSILKNFDVVGVLEHSGCHGTHFFELLLSRLQLPIYPKPVHSYASGRRGLQNRSVKHGRYSYVGRGTNKEDASITIKNASHHAYDYHAYFLDRPHRPGEGGAKFREALQLRSSSLLHQHVQEALANATWCDWKLFEEFRIALGNQPCPNGILRFCKSSHPTSREAAFDLLLTTSYTKQAGYQKAQKLTARMLESQRTSRWDPIE